MASTTESVDPFGLPAGTEDTWVGLAETTPSAPCGAHVADVAERPSTVAQRLVDQLAAFGVREAFGVSGGAIAVLFDALLDSPIGLHHFRHECGAVFAAVESYFVTGRPAVVFTTTGPGLLNALTGVFAARGDGAKLILVSGHSNAHHRGRGATQETSSLTMPQDLLYGRGPWFDYAVRMEHPDEASAVARRLGAGLARPGGFIAHVALPMSLQSTRPAGPPRRPMSLPRWMPPAPSASIVDASARRLRDGEAVLWLGFGAREASAPLRALVERTGAPVMCSPRAKGTVPEDWPCFVGVTGLGGHPRVAAFMRRRRPRHAIVLGTRLGEPTTFWDADLLPAAAITHVDLDPEVPGAAFPDFETVGVQAEVGAFVRAVLDRLDQLDREAGQPPAPHAPPALPALRRVDALPPRGLGPVRPQVVMGALQRQVVDPEAAVVLAECGNAFAWCIHHLRFRRPDAFRVSTGPGSMGHAGAGVVGAALGRGGPAIAVVGDGSMLMLSEVSTAAEYGARAIWVVLNDRGYGMCRDGHAALGLDGDQLSFGAAVDFATWARAQGAGGERVDHEGALDAALGRALASGGPYVIDVIIDAEQPSPLVERFESLIRQGSTGQSPRSAGGWTR